MELGETRERSAGNELQWGTYKASPSFYATWIIIMSNRVEVVRKVMEDKTWQCGREC